MTALAMAALAAGCTVLSFGQQAPGAAPTPQAIEAGAWLEKGLDGYRKNQYADAMAALRKSVELDRANVLPHLLLAAAQLLQLQISPPPIAVPIILSSQANTNLLNAAGMEYGRVLEIDPNNRAALNALAWLSYTQATGASDPTIKAAAWDRAASDYERLSHLYDALPGDEFSKAFLHNRLAQIGVNRVEPIRTAARRKLNMEPGAPGPLKDPGVRAQYKAQCGAWIEAAIAHATRSLEVNPGYADNFRVLGFLLRERADLEDVHDDYAADIRAASDYQARFPIPRPVVVREEEAKAPPVQVHLPMWENLHDSSTAA